YYVVSWGEMIRAALPGMRAQVHALVSLTPAGRRALEAGEAALVDASMPAAARGRPEREILGFVADLSAKAGRVVRRADLKRAVESPRRPFLIEGPEEATTLQPTPDQQVAIDAIAALGASGRYATALLHGVTGSGKTEVYLRSIEKVIASGKRALYLVPEIGLTPLLARRMRSRFGDTLALMHSGLSEGERSA